MLRTFPVSVFASVLLLMSGTCGYAQLFDEPVDPVDPVAPSGPVRSGAFNTNAIPPGTVVPQNSFSMANGLTLAPGSGLISSGLEVVSVQPLSAGESSGLEAGDVLVAVAGLPVNDDSQLLAALASVPPGTVSVGMQVLDVKSGRTISGRFMLETLSGMYQSNLGRVELKQVGETITATLSTYSNFDVTLAGRVSGSNVSGNWKDARAGGSFRLQKVSPGPGRGRSILEGSLTSSRGTPKNMTLFPLN